MSHKLTRKDEQRFIQLVDKGLNKVPALSKELVTNLVELYKVNPLKACLFKTQLEYKWNVTNNAIIEAHSKYTHIETPNIKTTSQLLFLYKSLDGNDITRTLISSLNAGFNFLKSNKQKDLSIKHGKRLSGYLENLYSKDCDACVLHSISMQLYLLEMLMSESILDTWNDNSLNKTFVSFKEFFREVIKTTTFFSWYIDIQLSNPNLTKDNKYQLEYGISQKCLHIKQLTNKWSVTSEVVNHVDYILMIDICIQNIDLILEDVSRIGS